jgi:asparagine synthase (glutamine-hydrolysing)
MGFLPEIPDWDRIWRSMQSRPFRTRAMIADLATTLPEVLLVKIDRAAMSRSIECRSPFLDHRIVEFALGLPSTMTRDKMVLRQLAYKYVPRKLIDRPKQGFNSPYGEWLRGPLASMLRDLVTPNRMAELGFETFEPITVMIESHLSRQTNFARRLWSLLLLSLWHDWYCATRVSKHRRTASAFLQAGVAAERML